MDSKTISYHEAAHAVMALSVGIKFTKATIIPSGGARGYINTEGQTFSGLWELIGAIEVIMAGPIAQAIINGTPVKEMPISGPGATDEGQIIRLLRENEKIISRNEVSRFVGWVFFRAHLHLVQRWKLVERIATALQATRTLSYEECKELMTAEMVA